MHIIFKDISIRYTCTYAFLSQVKQVVYSKVLEQFNLIKIVCFYYLLYNSLTRWQDLSPSAHVNFFN